MRLLVCGGRNFNNVKLAVSILQQIHQTNQVTTLICGMARGADMIGHAWATALDIPIVEFPVTDADWQSYGKAAGHIRNHQMLKHGNPDMVLAFHGGNGTAHMCKIAHAARIPVLIIDKEFIHGEE